MAASTHVAIRHRGARRADNGGIWRLHHDQEHRAPDELAFIEIKCPAPTREREVGLFMAGSEISLNVMIVDKSIYRRNPRARFRGLVAMNFIGLNVTKRLLRHAWGRK